ncbi:ferritin-like domain-containing protein, partial [Ramlibacter sp. H39-3-26]|uniref:sulfurtransferase TusA family protein n=1 Tax=Curvibacter soli TaxID=3031331 RepID=UPI003AF0E808|nr:ferritin-like domain-containing protein [Ramlibacter sp. H39-3-26]
MMTRDASPSPLTDIEALGFDAGAHLLVKHALATLPVGGTLAVTGRAPGWQVQLADWCRSQGHTLAWDCAARGVARVTRGGGQAGRWRGAAATGHSD